MYMKKDEKDVCETEMPHFCHIIEGNCDFDP